MGNTYGRNSLYKTGIPLQVSADGEPKWKTGGITLDWSKVAAFAVDTTLGDGTLVKAGQKALQYGTILCQTTGTNNSETITMTGSPTGGTFNAVDAAGNQSPAIPYNATAAQVQAALQAMTVIGPDNVNVTGSGPWVVTGVGDLANAALPPLTFNNANLTGGASPNATIANTTSAVSPTGLFSPYNSGASDGTQTLTRGGCYILNETVIENFPLGLGIQSPPSNHPAVFDGGLVWKNRLSVGGAGQPSWSAFEAAFPMIRYAQ